MGSSLSRILTKIFMNNTRNKIMSNKNFSKYILFCYRYVDDVTCLFNSSKRQLDEFIFSVLALSPHIHGCCFVHII